MTSRQLTFRSISLAVFLIAAGASLRILRDAGILDVPPNVSPVAAMAMFGAVYLPRRVSLTIPFALMVMSDLVIGFDRPGITVAIYASFGASLALGFWLKRRVSVGRTVLAVLAGSSLFFVVTNAAVWMFTTMYPHTMLGLQQAYVSGLPFFRNTVVGDMAYTGALFGLYNVVVVYWKQRLSSTDHALSHG